MVERGSLVVAAGQAASVAADVAANVATAARLTRDAGQRGVRLLVLPEAFLTGYAEEAFAGPVLDADHLDDAVLDPLRTAAADAGCTVVVGTALQRGDIRTLSLLMIRANGDASAPYDKQHLMPVERPYFEPGDHGASVVVDGLELGLSVCYDCCFPEHARAAAEAGAVGYLNAAAFSPGSAHRRDLYAAARALDNGLFVVFSGLTGRCGPDDFVGGSAVYEPEGRPLVRLGQEEGLAVATIDPALVATTRTSHSMLADHLPGLGDRWVTEG